MKSPYFYCYYNSVPCKVTVDSGAESNIVSLCFVQKANIKMTKASQTARQLDKSMIRTCGEINVDLHYGDIVMHLSALVVESMDSDILAGVPFCRNNNLEFSFAKEEIYIQGKVIKYGSHSSVRSVATTSILRNTSPTVLYPGEFLEISNPAFERFGDECAIEPRHDSPHYGTWPEPEITRVIDCSVRIPNRSNNVVYLAKNQHFGQINRVVSIDDLQIDSSYDYSSINTASKIKPRKDYPFSDAIPVDPGNQLTISEKEAFIISTESMTLSLILVLKAIMIAVGPSEQRSL